MWCSTIFFVISQFGDIYEHVTLKVDGKDIDLNQGPLVFVLLEFPPLLKEHP